MAQSSTPVRVRSSLATSSERPTAGPQIRSRERVRELAEVYTAEREVKAMVDLITYEAASVASRFLEPACGNGNFLVEILDRKLQSVATHFRKTAEFELNTILAVASIYGIDICSENVSEARERLFALVVDHYSLRHNTLLRPPYFDSAARTVLTTNIVEGDFLNPGELRFTEYRRTARSQVARSEYRLADLFVRPGQLPIPPTPVLTLPAVPYRELGDA